MGWTVIALFFLTLGGPPQQHAKSAEGAGNAANATCLACHGQEGFKSDTGKDLHVDEGHFQKSVHAGLTCTTCHSSITGFPHPAKIEPVNCGMCHSGEASDVADSVHAQDSPLPCLGCHGNPHAIVTARDAESPVYPLNVPKTCGTCHKDPALAKKYGFPNVYSMYMDSIHGFALTKDGLLVAATCSSCHGTHKILSHTNPQSRTYRTNIPNTCGSCHAGPKTQYLAGIHGKQMTGGNPKAPVCTDCHTAHQIARVERASWQMKTSATCGNCHKERFTTYLDTFHAQVSALGYIETAHCWNCHGFHDILPASDPKSPVHTANLVKTCGDCHPGANRGFVSYQPHADPRNREAYPAMWFTAKFMNLLLLSVLGFFALHTLLWFIRSFVHTQQNGAGREEVRQ